MLPVGEIKMHNYIVMDRIISSCRDQTSTTST